MIRAGVALFVVCWISQGSVAENLKVRAEAGRVEFVALGRPAMLKIKGESRGPEGQLELNKEVVKGELKFQLEGLNTGIGLRDNHMKNKYLEVGKYPSAILKIENLKVEGLSGASSAKSVKFDGELTMHGVSKPVHGSAEISADPKGYKTHAVFSVAIKEFNIDIPSYAGIRVADTVDVNVDFQAERVK